MNLITAMTVFTSGRSCQSPQQSLCLQQPKQPPQQSRRSPAIPAASTPLMARQPRLPHSNSLVETAVISSTRIHHLLGSVADMHNRGIRHRALQQIEQISSSKVARSELNKTSMCLVNITIKNTYPDRCIKLRRKCNAVEK